MRIGLTARSDYALRAMLEVSRTTSEGPRKARQIAAAMDIPPTYVGQILARLASHGLVHGTAGPSGGYRLGRPARDINVLEVVEAVDGPVFADACILGGGPHRWTGTCPLHAAWCRASDHFRRALVSIRLDDLARVDALIEAGTYEPPDDTPPHACDTPRRGVRD